MFRKSLQFLCTALTAYSLQTPFYCPLPEEPLACDSKATLPSARRCARNCNTFVSASALLWQAKTWGLEFAERSHVPNTPGGSNQTFDEKLFVPDFSWEPGFQLLLGGYLPYDGWDMSARWIFYKERFTDLKKYFNSVIAPSGIGIIPLWQYPFLQIVGDNTGNPLRYESASGHWKLIFNTVNLELGRSVFPEKQLPMRLSIGVKLASIQQKYRVEYADGNTILALLPQGSSPSLFQFISSQFQVKTDQFGMGPRVGLESNWNLRWGFSLIGHGAFSVLTSFFNVKTEYNDVYEPTPGPCTMRMREHFTELTPVCEAMLGIDWGKCFCKKFYLGLQLGFEWQHWWSINHARRNYVQTLPGETFDVRGELQMQGLNAAIKLDF